MAGPRWRETRQALSSLVEVASQYDHDGVDLHFLNDRRKENIRSAAQVEALFDTIDPDGITPTGEKLEELLLDYMLKIEGARDADETGAKLKAIKPVNFLVLTDGAPCGLYQFMSSV